MAFLDISNSGFGLGANNPFKRRRMDGSPPIPLGGPRSTPIVQTGISLPMDGVVADVGRVGRIPIATNVGVDVPLDISSLGSVGVRDDGIQNIPLRPDIISADVPSGPAELLEVSPAPLSPTDEFIDIRPDIQERPIPLDPGTVSGRINDFKPPTPPSPPPSPPRPPRDGMPDPNDPARVPSRSRIFTKFDMVDDVISDVVQVNTKGIWGGGSGSLSIFYTGSNTATQKQYYYQVYNGDPSNCQYGKQFDVAYGHYFGSGSSSGGGQTNDSPTRAVYSQFKNITQTNPTVESKFDFTGIETNQIYTVLFNRARMEDRVDPGNWEINLAKLNGADYANQYFTGSNVGTASDNTVYRFIDNSGDSDESISLQNAYLGGLTYDIVSGSISNGVFSTTSWGKFYPDLGMLIFDGDKLDTELGFNSMTSSNADGENAHKMFISISGSAVINSINTFDARSSDVQTTTHYFVRVRANEYNFTNNPTFITGTVGEFRQSTFEQNPRTYITTVGLYNNRKELLAVGKLSKPILKSFTNEALITVKLKY